MLEEIKVSIRGITPFLMNAFHPEDTTGTPKLSGPAVMGDPTEWRRKVHLNSQGQVCFPSSGVMRCWSNAGANIKSGRNKETFKRIIPSGIFIHHEQDEMIPFLIDGSPFTLEDIGAFEVEGRGLLVLPTVDSRPVRQGNSGIMRYRMRIPVGWVLSFEVNLLSEIQLQGLMEALIIAGQRYGLGDFRPSSPKPGPYGMFVVIRFGDFHDDDIQKANPSSAPTPTPKRAAKKEEAV